MANNPEDDAASAPDLETITGDIATLKRDLAALMNHLKLGAKDGISEAATHIGDKAARVYETLAAQGGSSARSVGHHIEERPILWLLAAFAAGFVGGRVLPR